MTFIIILSGLISGSFIGVLFYRIPLNKPIVFARSKCDHCNTLVPFYNNIPIISFIMQKGRCKFCKHKIDAFYPILELICLMIFLITYKFYGLNIIFFYKVLIFLIFILISSIDIKIQIIPDRLIITSLIISFLYHFYLKQIEFWYLGMASYSLPMLILYGTSDIFKKELVGFGDVKLMCSIGGFLAYTNLRNLVYFYEILYLSAGIFALFMTTCKKINTKSYIAFAPFICVTSFFLGVLYE